MNLSRDSLVLWVGMIGAVLTAVANQAGVFPPEWYPYINMGALVCATICGWMKTSPLPGAKDAQKVDVSKIAPLLVVAVALTVMGCAKPASIQSPEATRAWQANQVLTRVAEVQAAAIQAEASGALKTADVRIIVTATVAVAKAAKDAPEGWPKVALTALQQAKAQLPPAVLASSPVAYALAIVEGMLISLVGGAA